MSYTTLMVYVDAGHTPEEQVRVAANLADKFHATLIGLSAIAIRPTFVAEGVIIDEVTEREIGEMRARLARKENWFRSFETGQRKFEWRALLDFPNDALMRDARSADLILIPRTKGSEDPYRSLDPGGAILNVGRPTLVVPDGVSTLQADHVVIGWKDGREARRAVWDSLPFLHEASRVTIAEICETEGEAAAREHIDDVANYLTRHRVDSGPRVILHKEGTGAASLIKLAREEGADLLVTGAYGHSRLGEWIFGGMTRDLLATSPICCLMSH